MDGDSATMTSRSGFKAGIRVRVSDDVQDAGRCGIVVGNEVFVGQWWCPVLWDDAEDPDFHKSGCIEPLGQPTSADWREVLHTLTKQMQTIVPDNPVGMRIDRIMAIVGKIGSGDMDRLDTDELDEIRRSLMLDAENCVDGGVRLRTISGKIGPSSGADGRLVLPPDNQEVLLAKLYADAPCAVGKLCDDELDRSGALLGRVRGLVIKHNEQKAEQSAE